MLLFHYMKDKGLFQEYVVFVCVIFLVNYQKIHEHYSPAIDLQF